MELDKWDYRFLDLAKNVSSWSKDPSTQIGSVFVKDRRILSTGYNGFPSGMSDCTSRYNNREIKYKYIVHAEKNAIYNATHHGISLNGSTCYVYGLPVCSECAKGLIQVGTKRVICLIEKKEIPDTWLKSWKITSEFFIEAGIEFKIIWDDNA